MGLGVFDLGSKVHRPCERMAIQNEASPGRVRPVVFHCTN